MRDLVLLKVMSRGVIMTLVIAVFLLASTLASPRSSSPSKAGSSAGDPFAAGRRLLEGAPGASGVVRSLSESLAAGEEGIWGAAKAVKRTMMVDGRSYVCCIGDIFCVSGTCESSSLIRTN